jgi:hypothetical protein
MKWKILVFSDKPYFAGEEHLVENPKDAKWFDSYAKAANASKDIVALNIKGVTQVRLISEAYEL